MRTPHEWPGYSWQHWPYRLHMSAQLSFGSGSRRASKRFAIQLDLLEDYGPQRSKAIVPFCGEGFPFQLNQEKEGALFSPVASEHLRQFSEGSGALSQSALSVPPRRCGDISNNCYKWSLEGRCEDPSESFSALVFFRVGEGTKICTGGLVEKHRPASDFCVGVRGKAVASENPYFQGGV